MSSITEETGCIECQKPATFMCSSCGHDGPRYCSVDCQKNHWQKNHYKVCKAAVRNRQRIQQETSMNSPF
jgi:hypothetical protein